MLLHKLNPLLNDDYFLISIEKPSQTAHAETPPPILSSVALMAILNI
jgi:hypothetical protein